MTTPILWHYDTSPFGQKVRLAFGIKSIAWQSVATPIILPKPDLVRLTGGYRGVPVMQIGPEVFVDSQVIVDELERRYPAPSLYPNGNKGMPLALGEWAQTVFGAAFLMILPTVFATWPDAVQADRRAMFSQRDYDALLKRDEPFGVPGARFAGEFRSQLGLIEEQLNDGRAFLQGTEPGLADIQAGFVLRFILAFAPHWAGITKGFPHLDPWISRLDAIGEGLRDEIQARDAFEAAAAADPPDDLAVDGDDPLIEAVGQAVRIEPTDARRGGGHGTLVGLRFDRISLAREEPGLGRIVVHFPRMRYRLEPASP